MRHTEIQSYIEKSEEELKKREEELIKTEQEVRSFFEQEILTQLSISKIIMQSRVKTSKSLKEKIIRKNYHNQGKNPEQLVNSLPDLVGIRLSCMLNKDEKEIDQELKDIFKESSGEFYFLKGKEDFKIKLKDKPDVQKNNHIIFKYECKFKNSEGNEINVELQIKSLVHTLWGELEHMLVYKNYNYSINSSLNSDVLNSTFEILLDLDNQLEVINKHISSKTSIKESRALITKLFYEYTSRDINKFLEVEIDLREMYDIVVQTIINKSDIVEENIIEVLEISKNIQDLANIDYKKEFEELESVTEREVERITDLDSLEQDVAILFTQQVLQGDIYWKLYFILLKKLLNDKTTYAKFFVEVSQSLISQLQDFDSFNSDLADIVGNESFANELRRKTFNRSVVDFITTAGKIGIVNQVGFLKSNFNYFIQKDQNKDNQTIEDLRKYQFLESPEQEKVEEILKRYLMITHYISYGQEVPNSHIQYLANLNQEDKELITFDLLRKVIDLSENTQEYKDNLKFILEDKNIIYEEEE